MDSPGDSGLRCFQGGWGCGFCGNIGEPTPYCCAQGREWARRFIAILGIPAHAESTEITLEERHLDARWERVLRRWRAKAGSGAPPLENASDP